MCEGRKPLSHRLRSNLFFYFLSIVGLFRCFYYYACMLWVRIVSKFKIAQTVCSSKKFNRRFALELKYWTLKYEACYSFFDFFCMTIKSDFCKFRAFRVSFEFESLQKPHKKFLQRETSILIVHNYDLPTTCSGMLYANIKISGKQKCRSKL